MSSDGVKGRPAQLTGEAFKRACGRFATGVTIASVLDGQGTPQGLTVSSFTAVSLDPPLVSICLGHAVASIDLFRAARYFGVNVLRADQRDLSQRFARKGHERFDGLAWERGASGVPLLAGVLAAMECETEQRIRAGDHDIFVARMVHAHVGEGDPLIHFASRYRRLALD
ncbi:MAG TPA: flavin reductase family protein [Bryobacteraceae bacterium]|nr:flavin reductase family protein [Bryobacteraceae bacterium]